MYIKHYFDINDKIKLSNVTLSTFCHLLFCLTVGLPKATDSLVASESRSAIVLC